MRVRDEADVAARIAAVMAGPCPTVACAGTAATSAAAIRYLAIATGKPRSHFCNPRAASPTYGYCTRKCKLRRANGSPRARRPQQARTMTAKPSRSILSRVIGLHWLDPFKALPHGFSGLGCVSIGIVLIIAALAGDIRVTSHPFLQGLYAYATFANAAAGLFITGRAPKHFQGVFARTAVFQMCLVYYVARFMPGFPGGGTLLITALDMAVAAFTVLAIFSFAVFGIQHMPPTIAVALLIGSVALALLAGYPLQLAILGDEWWQCVQVAYPMQAIAMVAYIYIPATWAFAVMLFGSTLWNRKIIGDLALGLGFAGLVIVTLVSTVLMQEVHLPDVSTQMLWLPCPAPPPGSWSAWVAQKFDTSALARSVLAMLRDPPTPPPPPTMRPRFLGLF